MYADGVGNIVKENYCFTNMNVLVAISNSMHIFA